MTTVINQLSNEIGTVPVSIAIGGITGQSVAIMARKKPLSPFAIITTAGLSFISYGYISSNNFQFLEKDLSLAWNEIIKVPEAIISTVENTIKSITGYFSSSSKQQQTTFFGIPV